MPGKSRKDGEPRYASPACYAHEVDPDYIWAPDSARKDMTGTQDGVPSQPTPDGSPPKAS